MDKDAGSSDDLCVSCGICCDGALFDQGPVYPDEEARARRLGFSIVERDDGRRYFLIPCGNLCGSVCQVYDMRLTTCRTYKCTTLQAAEAGEIARSEADRRVAAGREAIANVRRFLLPGESFMELRARFGDDPGPSPEFKLAMVRWNLAMDRFFRKPHQRVFGREPKPQEQNAVPVVPSQPCMVETNTPAEGGWPPELPRSPSTERSPPY